MRNTDHLMHRYIPKHLTLAAPGTYAVYDNRGVGEGETPIVLLWTEPVVLWAVQEEQVEVNGEWQLKGGAIHGIIYEEGELVEAAFTGTNLAGYRLTGETLKAFITRVYPGKEVTVDADFPGFGYVEVEK